MMEIAQNSDSFFNNAYDPMLVIDPYSDALIAANREAIRLLGFQSQSVQEICISKLFKKSFTDLVVFTQSVIEHGKGWCNDIKCTTSAGEILVTEISGRIYSEENQDHLILTLRNTNAFERLRNLSEVNSLYRHGLTKWKTIESVFKEIERKNQLILSAVGEGIYGVNANGETTFINSAAVRMLGWASNELIGHNIHSIIHHSHSDGSFYPNSECPIFTSTYDGNVHHSDNEVFWRKDGSSFPVEYTSTPIRDNGLLVGTVVIFRDISERKQSEEKLHNALEEVIALRTKLEQENAYLQEEIHAEHNYKEIVGKSEAILTIIRQVELVAPTDANVLITGESGTGKELIARAIHQSSKRKDRPLIRVNCASIPRELFESEFFGHVKGAFTGAIDNRTGRFELADGGTLFLDEVGEIPLELQSKLLRVLQEQQFERVGENRTRKIDVRVIAATNKDLKTEVSEGNFRNDLYYRLNVFPIELVSLRQRKEDIPMLASHFIQIAAKKFNKLDVKLSVADIQRLQHYSWPGNIRELINIIERAVILSQSGKLLFELPQTNDTINSASNSLPSSITTLMTEADKQLNERNNIIEALKVTKGKVFGFGGAAELLGVKPTTLSSRIKKLGINRLIFCITDNA